MSTSKSFNAHVPFCFSNSADAEKAEKRVNTNFDFGDLSAYATGRTLFVPEHKSLSFRFVVEDFVKALGGRRHCD